MIKNVAMRRTASRATAPPMIPPSWEEDKPEDCLAIALIFGMLSESALIFDTTPAITVCVALFSGTSGVVVEVTVVVRVLSFAFTSVVVMVCVIVKVETSVL